MEQGVRKGEAALDRLETKVEKTETVFDQLKSEIDAVGAAFAALGITAVVSQFNQMLNTSTELNNRLRLVTRTAEQQDAVYRDLLRSSNATRTLLESNATVYNKIAVATRSLNLTYRDQINVVERLNKIQQISGTNAQEGAAAIRQLAQGLASGALRGDEFISVSENLPYLLDLLVDEFNRTSGGIEITRGQLRDMAADGRITSEVLVGALTNAAQKIDEDFSKVSATSESAMNVMYNSALDAVVSFDRLTGASGLVAQGLLLAARNTGPLLAGFSAIAVMAASTLIPTLLRLGAILLSNPASVAVIGVAALIAALVKYADTTLTIGKTTATVWQVTQAAFLTAKDGAIAAWTFLSALYTQGIEAANQWAAANGTSINSWTSMFSDGVNAIVGYQRWLFETIVSLEVAAYKSVVAVWNNLPDAFDLVGKLSIRALVTVLEQGMRSVAKMILTSLNVIGDIATRFGRTNPFKDIFDPDKVFDFTALKPKFDNAEANLILLVKDAFTEAFSTDYVSMGIEGLENAKDVVASRFYANLERILATQQRSSDEQDVLNGKFDEAMKKLGAIDDFDGKRQKLQPLDESKGMGLKVPEPPPSVQGGFLERMQEYSKAGVNAAQSIGDAFGDLWVGISDGAANSIGRAIVYGDDLKESLGNVARQALADLISSLVKVGLQSVTNAALARSLGAATTAASVGMAATAGAAWAKPAAAASLATFGANAAPASAGIASTFALAQSLALPKFRDGTDFVDGAGTGRSDSILALLSRGEGVVSADANQRNPGAVRALNSGQKIGGTVNVTVLNQAPGVSIEVEQVTANDVRIIARAEARRAVAETTPRLVAEEIRDPNSRTSKAMAQSFEARRRR